MTRCRWGRRSISRRPSAACAAAAPPNDSTEGGPFARLNTLRPTMGRFVTSLPSGQPSMLSFGRRPRSDPDLCDRHFLPTLLCKQGLAPRVSNAERADEDPTFLLSQDGVPHRRGVARPLDRVPGPDRLVVLVHQLRLGELTPRGHPTVLRVDEEDTHSDRG